MKAKVHLFYAWLLLLCMASIGQSQAQCPTAASFTNNVTAATCPSNGIIQLNNPADVPVTGGTGLASTLYHITSGPAGGGFQTTAQSANKFEGLPPGDYTITVTKDGCASVSVPVTIANQYTPLSLNATVSGVCPGNGVVGATINADVTGGKTPVTYAFVKSNNANIPDAGLTYGSSSTFNVTTGTGGYGTYQVRAKDQCGVFVTRSVDVVPTIGPADYEFYNIAGKDCNTFTMFGALNSAAGIVDPAVAPGYKLEIFDVTGNLPSPCAVPSGATPIISVTIDDAGDLNFDFPKAVKQFVTRTTSPCGDVSIKCVDISANDFFTPFFGLNGSASCERNSAGINKVKLQVELYRYGYPIQVVISNTATGATITTDTWTDSFDHLNTYTVDYLAGGYTVMITDACGETRTKTIIPAGPGAAITTVVATDLACASVIGAKRAYVKLTGETTGLFDDGSTFNLISGPSGTYSPVIPGTLAPNGTLYWDNLTPGTYTAQIGTTTAGCGPTNFTFTVPPNTEDNPGLVFSLNGTSTILCGGTGTITSQLDYNGFEVINYELLNSSGGVITNNSTGSFANIPAGTYTVRAGGMTFCGNAFSATKQYTILPAGAKPVITKKLGITCEDGNTQLATGQALFEFNGVAPYLLEMKLEGASIWDEKASNLTGNTFTVSDLNANATYDVRLTDNCGNSTVTTVSIKPLEALTVTNTAQPCLNQPYTLSAPDLPGSAYSWSKNGSVISNSKDINFSSFAPSDNGTYTCTVTISGCVVRTLMVTLNSNNCGGPLPVSLVSFTANVQENKSVLLAWVTAMERNNDYFQLERSKDLVAFDLVSQVSAKEGQSAQNRTYRFVDSAPFSGTSYYRLSQVDLDGTRKVFPAISVVVRSEAYGVFPNPVKDGQFTLNLDEPQAALVKFFAADGRPVGLQKAGNTDSSLHLKATQTLTTGVYLLTVEERGQLHQYRIVIN